jgi:hypothetical protein
MARGTGQYVAVTLPAVVSGQRENLFQQLHNIVTGAVVGAFPVYGATTFELYDTAPGDAVNARNRVYRSFGDRTVGPGSTGDAQMFYQLGLGTINTLPGGFASTHWADAYQDWAISNGNGTTDSISAPVVSQQTVTIAGANFNSALVNRLIWISDATNPTNNGVFTVSAFISSTQIKIANAAGVAEASFAGKIHYGLRNSNNNASPPSFSPTIDDGAQIDIFAERNQYEFVFVFIQSGTVYIGGATSPIRNHIAPLHSGVGRLTGGPYAPGTTVLNVDRDLTASLQVTSPPQRVWIYDATRNPNDPLPTDNSEIVFVTAVSPTQITLQAPGIVNTHNANAMVGDDPSPFFHFIIANTSNPSLFGINRADGTYVEAASNGAIVPQTNAITPLSNNPATGTGFFVGATGAILMSAGPTSMRGNPQHWNFWPVGAQVDRDRMLPNFSVPNAQKFFKSLQNASFALAIGPGATTSP